MKVSCKLCEFEREKPHWEHIINEVNKLGGNIDKDKCPNCRHERILEYDFTENK